MIVVNTNIDDEMLYTITFVYMIVVIFPKKKKQIKNKKKPCLLLKLKYRPKEKK